jgi:hypothetical protein
MIFVYRYLNLQAFPNEAYLYHDLAKFWFHDKVKFHLDIIPTKCFVSMCQYLIHVIQLQLFLHFLGLSLWHIPKQN